METKIGPDIRKPFRGLTTIQLFDKNTGELIEEYHDENTYNDRLQYINYLNTILHCQGPNIASSIEPYSKSLSDEVTNMFQIAYTYKVLGGSNVSSDVSQLFATLMLTNLTSAETAHGYFNGVPVGIADAAGADATFANRTCTGLLNVTESYIGNDRLHLVFDFATDKCNVQFDSLWLFPSNRRQYSSGQISYNYSACKPFQTVEISSEQLSYNFDTNYTYINVRYKINDNYTVLAYSNNRSAQDESRAIHILNDITGELVTSCTFSSATHIYAPFYYDVSLNVLYCMYGSSDNGKYLLDPSNKKYNCILQINLSDGAVSTKSYMQDLLNLTYDTFSYDSAQQSYFDYVFTYLTDGSASLMVRTRGKDSSTLEDSYHVTFFTFDAATCTFTLLKKHKVYTNPYDTQYIFTHNGLMYTTLRTNVNAANNNFYTVFDLKTGLIKNDSMMSISVDFLGNVYMSQRYTCTNDSAILWTCVDLMTYRRAVCVVSKTTSDTDITPASVKLYKKKYFTAVWSTHNKLTSAIKKTDMTTMKIQYDIVWDSIPDVILPALL